MQPVTGHVERSGDRLLCRICTVHCSAVGLRSLHESDLRVGLASSSCNRRIAGCYLVVDAPPSKRMHSSLARLFDVHSG